MNLKKRDLILLILTWTVGNFIISWIISKFYHVLKWLILRNLFVSINVFILGKIKNGNFFKQRIWLKILPNKILENYQLLITFLIFGYITILISINHVSHVTLILNTVKKYWKRNGVMIGVILIFSLGKRKTTIKVLLI